MLQKHYNVSPFARKSSICCGNKVFLKKFRNIFFSFLGNKKCFRNSVACTRLWRDIQETMSFAVNSKHCTCARAIFIVVKAPANEETIMQKQCCPECYPICRHTQHLFRKEQKMFLNLFRHLLLPQQRFLVHANGETLLRNVSATMFPYLRELKTKTKVISLTNHRGRKQRDEPMRTRSKYV